MIEALDDKRAQKKAERSDGPGKLPVCQRLRRGGCGVAVLPKDRTASSSDSLRLSERRAKRKASSAANPATATTQVAPQRSEGVADIRVAFALPTFLWRNKGK